MQLLQKVFNTPVLEIKDYKLIETDIPAVFMAQKK